MLSAIPNVSAISPEMNSMKQYWRFIMKQSNRHTCWLLSLICGFALFGVSAASADDWIEIPADVLEDKIRGGLLGQLLGNLNGLPHENKYIDEPGNVEGYVPGLPEGARTDDDTDIEWVYISEMARTGEIVIPYYRIGELWRKHINRNIWCANAYAKVLMDIGYDPPITGDTRYNPWAEFNISGQFLCESFALVSPAMPEAARRIGTHYTGVAVSGEPIVQTKLFVTMIAKAFYESDINTLLDSGLRGIQSEPQSRPPRGIPVPPGKSINVGWTHSTQLGPLVEQVRAWHKEHPDDWRATRAAIKEKYSLHGGTTRDWNGYELNTACTIAALLYGEGDLVKTLEIAFNLGWDCDNNAATAATIIGVIKGRKWMDQQGWVVKDVYKNITRDEMPDDETITGFGDKLVDVAERVLIHAGAQRLVLDGQDIWRITPNIGRTFDPDPRQNWRRLGVHRSAIPEQQLDPERLFKELVSGEELKHARIAYGAIAEGRADQMRLDRPDDWAKAITALKKQEIVVTAMLTGPMPSGRLLKGKAAAAGLTLPEQK